MQESMVSEATIKNWNRLGVEKEEQEKRLSSRANKRLSKKNILPLEYFVNKENITYLEEIVKYIEGKKLSTQTILYCLALNKLLKNNLIRINNNNIFSKNKNIKKILKDFESKIDDTLLDIEIPQDEEDFLGIVYQYLQNEGDKNIKGSYYTPQDIIKKTLKSIKKDDKFLDPCCGSGSFLLQASNIISNPEHIYGCDKDNIACFIAKINLVIRFKDIDFYPNIYNIDFLDNNKIFEEKSFDIVATNPPWGAYIEDKYKKIYQQIKSGESFSYFILKSQKLVKKQGQCAFILPESILNVKVHQDIRKFILENYSISSIENLGKIFTGVLSNIVLLKLGFDNSGHVNLIDNGNISEIEQKYYLKNVNNNFSFINQKDVKLLDKLYSKEYETLLFSDWGLGIVTGNNKKYLSAQKQEQYEPIYTGKEVSKYFLLKEKNYIKYDRKNYQQVAKNELYRASEKLLYKFISKKLVFSYDNRKSLVLNSANIIIPKLKTHSIKTALAYLNSNVFQYIYSKKFNELKVLKNNLCALPFPLIAQNEKEELEKLVNNYLISKDLNIARQIENFVNRSFNLSKDEIDFINDFCV